MAELLLGWTPLVALLLLGNQYLFTAAVQVTISSHFYTRTLMTVYLIPLGTLWQWQCFSSGFSLFLGGGYLCEKRRPIKPGTTTNFSGLIRRKLILPLSLFFLTYSPPIPGQRKEYFYSPFYFSIIPVSHGERRRKEKKERKERGCVSLLISLYSV